MMNSLVQKRRRWTAYLSSVLATAVVASMCFGGVALAQSSTPIVAEHACDVEPLSVDRVMEIVEHPGYFMMEGPAKPGAGEPLIGHSPEPARVEIGFDIPLRSDANPPTETDFADATIVANEYLNCMLYGTQGQVWSLLSPSHIQRTILAEFPVYANESDVRSRVEERILEPGYEGEWFWNNLPFREDIGLIEVNQDIQLALTYQTDLAYVSDVMQIGVKVDGADGETIALTNGLGKDLIPGDPRYTRFHDGILMVTMLKHRESDVWLVVPTPSGAELGW